LIGKLRIMSLATAAADTLPITPAGKHATTTLCAPILPKVYALSSPAAFSTLPCSSSSVASTAAFSTLSAQTMPTE
jgi:hypothetical protein